MNFQVCLSSLFHPAGIGLIACRVLPTFIPALVAAQAAAAQRAVADLQGAADELQALMQQVCCVLRHHVSHAS
jgi:hypothetical protein